ncbi:hypothetical protein [Microbispora bryophytorum]|uniref:hypothetical protein n=1 Tax=Microbispora bryophytorum TaxID=1460882 RepID=UPI0033E474D1
MRSRAGLSRTQWTPGARAGAGAAAWRGGPACQFHNRDRYQHPDRYTRHKTGTDR